MYSAMIVDDEITIREKLPKLIDFGRYGFSVCATAQNGEEALPLILHHNPNVLFLDVRMPVMDGLSLLRRLRECGHDGMFVIILSGYSDFEYAKRAMDFGVKAYLTKPVDEEEAEKILADIAGKLDLRRLEAAKSKYREDLTALRNLINESEGFYVSDQYYLIHLLPISLQTQDEAIRPYPLILQQMTACIGMEEDGLFRKSGHIHSFLVPRKAVSETAAGMLPFAQTIDHALQQKGLSCAYLLDTCILRERDVPFWAVFNHHLSLLLRKVFYSTETIISYADMSVETEAAPAFHETLERLLESLRKDALLMDKSRTLAAFSSLSALIAQVQPDLNTIIGITDRIYYALVSMLSSLRPAQSGNGWLHRIVLRDTPVFWGFERWKQMISKQVEDAFALVQQSKRIVCAGMNNDLLEYVNQNYRTPLSVKRIAEHFHMNSAYLGRYFQKAAGVSFHQYLNQLRIAEAKRLLQDTDMLVYEIAEEVGFSESSYFVTKFVASESMSPLEYRNRHVQAQWLSNP